MSWLERLNDRQTRRLARDLRSHAIQTRDLAQDQLQEFSEQARDIARSAAHQVVDYGRGQGGDLIRRRAGEYAHRAGEVARQIAEYGRSEGAVLAQAAAVQAARAGRAVKADPMPVIVGTIGAVLLASLLFGRRRH
jgi:hypothetical protein